MQIAERRRWLARTGSVVLGLAAAGLRGPARAQADPPAAADPRGGPLPAVGSMLALPEVPMLDGGRFRPADADGQVLVLYWWASWCPFCAQQSPLMDRLWREQSPRGLRMLALSIDKKPADAVGYLQRKGYAFPSGWVTPEVARVLPKPKGLPVTLVRGRDGRVRMAEAGQLFPEDVSEIARFLDA